MNLARKIQRRLLREGKLKPADYRKLRRSVDVDAKDDEINAPIRRRIWALRKLLATQGGDCSEGRVLRNLTGQARLREVIYHPTKGWRTRRGDEVEIAP